MLFENGIFSRCLFLWDALSENNLDPLKGAAIEIDWVGVKRSLLNLYYD